MIIIPRAQACMCSLGVEGGMRRRLLPRSRCGPQFRAAPLDAWLKTNIILDNSLVAIIHVLIRIKVDFFHRFHDIRAWVVLMSFRLVL